MIYIVFGYVWQVKTKLLNNLNLIIKLTGIIWYLYYSKIRFEVTLTEQILFIIYLLIMCYRSKNLFFGAIALRILFRIKHIHSNIYHKYINKTFLNP